MNQQQDRANFIELLQRCALHGKDHDALNGCRRLRIRGMISDAEAARVTDAYNRMTPDQRQHLIADAIRQRRADDRSERELAEKRNAPSAQGE